MDPRVREDDEELLFVAFASSNVDSGKQRAFARVTVDSSSSPNQIGEKKRFRTALRLRRNDDQGTVNSSFSRQTSSQLSSQAWKPLSSQQALPPSQQVSLCWSNSLAFFLPALSLSW